ncbi:hypothetical protein [Balneatrix alpica]|uniref:Uncharacterized protein n=1 Tax=Balneatrix alpica TaxID=75684 RepID=A0ABV5ZA05_9GAMM|nr:hypothetical protein [Balneatrix alpica]
MEQPNRKRRLFYGGLAALVAVIVVAVLLAIPAYSGYLARQQLNWQWQQQGMAPLEWQQQGWWRSQTTLDWQAAGLPWGQLQLQLEHGWLGVSWQADWQALPVWPYQLQLQGQADWQELQVAAELPGFHWQQGVQSVTGSELAWQVALQPEHLYWQGQQAQLGWRDTQRQLQAEGQGLQYRIQLSGWPLLPQPVAAAASVTLNHWQWQGAWPMQGTAAYVGMLLTEKEQRLQFEFNLDLAQVQLLGMPGQLQGQLVLHQVERAPAQQLLSLLEQRASAEQWWPLLNAHLTSGPWLQFKQLQLNWPPLGQLRLQGRLAWQGPPLQLAEPPTPQLLLPHLQGQFELAAPVPAALALWLGIAWQPEQPLHLTLREGWLWQGQQRLKSLLEGD